MQKVVGSNPIIRSIEIPLHTEGIAPTASACRFTPQRS
jgi:hypothetical protein